MNIHIFLGLIIEKKIIGTLTLIKIKNQNIKFLYQQYKMNKWDLRLVSVFKFINNKILLIIC
jgi:hypothetical protein